MGRVDVGQSPMLTALLERRAAMKAHSVMLLVTDTGRQVSERMPTDKWDDARGKSAKAHPELSDAILTVFNRDIRKRAQT